MAQYNHLNIYKASFDFLVGLSQQLKHFQREYRYTIGEKLTNNSIEFIALIYKANSAKISIKRQEYLEQMLEKLQYINILLRLSFELKNISNDKYIILAKNTQNIEKQLNGWLNQTINREKQK